MTSPTVRRRELGARLRALRLARDLTVDHVAAHMEVSPAKISRIETAKRGASVNDVRVLCDLYEVSEDDRERLLTLARSGRQRSWWQQYGLPEATQTYVGLEDEATAIHLFETSLVPGLLQTADYARAVTTGIALELSEEQIEQRVETRLLRQQLLDSDNAPELLAIVDEAALHRLVGGVEVMHAQLLALVERSRHPRVTLQVLPNQEGAHPGMNSAFTILQLEQVKDVVYVEGLIGFFTLENTLDLARYRRAFDRVRSSALSVNDTRSRLLKIADQLAP